MCFQSAAFASTESVKKENFLTSLISALLNPTPAGKHCSVVLSVPSLPQVPAYRCSVRVAFAISAALGCTHTPAAPGAAPAAASHLQLAELMLWPRESDSAPRSARSTCGNTQPQPQLHCKTLSRRQSRPKLFPEPRFPLLPFTREGLTLLLPPHPVFIPASLPLLLLLTPLLPLSLNLERFSADCSILRIL